MKWEEALKKELDKALYRGGEVKITFIKRQEKRIPIIESYIDNQIRCDEEVVLGED